MPNNQMTPQGIEEKTCIKCGLLKHISDFYKRKDSPDGYRNICKLCFQENAGKIRKLNHERYMKYRENYIKKYPKRVKNSRKKYKRNNKEKSLCSDRIHKAIKKGLIKRKGCIVCGKGGEGHHSDYSKALDVIWVCRKHHAKIHSKEGKKWIAKIANIK